MIADSPENPVWTAAGGTRMNQPPPMCGTDECHLLASLLDETPQGILVVDEDGLITHANLAMSVMFLPFQVIVGERLPEIRGLEFIANLVADAVRGHCRVETDLHFPMAAGVEAGGERFYHVVAAPWKEEGRQGVWVMVLDTTEHAMTGQIRSEFVTNAGHELRTPLSLIHGYIETLKSGMIKNPASLQRCLEVMDKHSRRMMRIIDDMLTLSRMEGDPAQMKTEPFLVRGCVEGVLEHLTPLVEAYHPVITLDFPEDGGLLHGDRFYWDQIFTHLIENALKENPRTGLRLRIAGRWSRHECILTVEDDGVGFRVEDVPQAFGHFHRTGQMHPQESRVSGLGLCIVRRAVEAHLGSVELESVPGVSTVFTIRVPLP